MTDTPTGETVVVTPPKNDATTTVTPPVEKTVDSEVEKLRKEKEQAEMRANQLANQLKAKEDAEAAAKAKQLEEQNEFKTLYEQKAEELQKLQAEKEQSERQAAIKAESDKLFNDFPKEVRELADETGLTLSDTDEDTIAEFKEKLDRISKKVAVQKVTPNNPGNTTPESKPSNTDLHAIMSDPKKFEEYVKKNFKGISQMTQRAE